MKASVPAIAPILRSDIQGALLAQLLLNPEHEFTLSELTRAAEASMPTLSREVDRLVAAEFLTQRRSGRNRYLSANRSHPLFRPVREIVEYAYGPLTVLPEALASIPGIDAAYIFGSWAARYRGEEGPDPADIDVLVIGRPPRDAMFDAELQARARLRREVNMQTVSSDRWNTGHDAFLETVRSRPMIRLDLNPRV